MIGTHLILSALWICFCCLHSVLAAGSVKTAIQRRLTINDGLYRVGYNIWAFVSLSVLLIFQGTIKSIPVFTPRIVVVIIAVILIVAGIAVMLSCILKYFKQLVGIGKASKNEQLETGGIHKFVRHPLYFGTFVFLGGLVLYFPLLSNFIAVAIIIIYTLIGIRFEEKKLIGKFGNSYLLYKQTTPMIIPRF